MTDLNKVVNENRDALLALAESDLRSSKYAQALLEAVEGELLHLQKIHLKPTQKQIPTVRTRKKACLLINT
jgi:hypothetical protein